LKKKLFLILDCETATIPPPKELQLTEKQRKTIAILKPLIYNIAWKIVDRKGEVQKQENFIVNEIFYNETLFNTAYYKAKRPFYLTALKERTIKADLWENISEVLETDLRIAEFCGAYNSMFDFKKAINFTHNYIQHYYSQYLDNWFEIQEKSIIAIINGHKPKNENFDKDNFLYKNKNYPLIDLWGLSCIYLLNNDKYREFCYKNNLSTQSKKFFSTTAESTYKFISQNADFVENHTALEDVEIEVEIFKKIMKKTSIKKMEKGIIYFPFRILGNYEAEENEGE
jgi:hypothetical protein